MKKISIRYYCWIVLGCAGWVPAAAQHTYTLEECINEALAHNVRMKNADNNVEAARQEKSSAFTKYFPTLSATGGGYMADKGLLEDPALGLSMLKNGVVGGVTASVPLFTGGQIVNGNRLAEVNVEATRLQHRLAENEVRLTTEKYYWQMVTLKAKLETLDAVRRQLEGLHGEVESAVEAGVTNRNDLLQVQLRKNETLSAVLSVQNALAVSRNLLAQYIGHAADSVEVEALPEHYMPENPAGLYRSPEASLRQTSEYNLQEQGLKASRLQYRMAVGKNMPTVAVGGGCVYDNLMDRDHSFWIGFASVSVPLTGWWGGSHDIKKQKLQLRNAENELTDRSQLLVIRMQNAYNDLTDAYEQVKIAREAIGQSEENLRLQQDYYHAGTCTMSDLLEAQTLYQKSRDRYVESSARYEVKKCEYLQSIGQ